MPGPVSDSYDPEWGTASAADDIRQALSVVYDKTTILLDKRPPMYILQIVQGPESQFKTKGKIQCFFSEKQLRLIRFSLERAGESL